VTSSQSNKNSVFSENNTYKKHTEEEYVKAAAVEGFKEIVPTIPKLTRKWSMSKIRQSELSSHIKNDPVIWQFFRRLHYQNKNFICIVVGEPGCQPKNSRVQMWNGKWKYVQDIKVGDSVRSPQRSGKIINAHVMDIKKYFSTSIYLIRNKKTNKILYKCAGNHIIPFSVNKNILHETAEDLYKRTSDLFSYDKNLKKIEIIIEKTPGAPVYGFGIDSKSHWYITGGDMVTNNSGKSLTALSLARAIDVTPLGDGKYEQNFIIKANANGYADKNTRVVFGPSDFMRLIKSGLPRGSCIVWDEAGVGNDATKWNDRKSQLIKHIMQTFRSRNYGVFMTVPDKESITLSTRRLVHCYIDIVKRSDRFAELSIVWLKRERTNEKTKTYYKRPVFVDPVTGGLKKIFVYKVPKLPDAIENQYNQIKNTTLQNLYTFYQRELEIMEKELGMAQEQGLSAGTKLKKFNMSAAVDISKGELKTLLGEDGKPSEAQIIFLLSKRGYECNKQQSKLVAEVIASPQIIDI